MAVERSEARIPQLVSSQARNRTRVRPSASQSSFPVPTPRHTTLNASAGLPADSEENPPHAYLPPAPRTGWRLNNAAKTPGPLLCQHPRALCAPVLCAKLPESPSPGGQSWVGAQL